MCADKAPKKHEIQVTVSELRQGMYVSSLDRPWLETPFMLQGFFIESEDDIDELARHCRYVYIDPERGATPFSLRVKPPPIGRQKSYAPLFPHRNLRSYDDLSLVEEELETARGVMHQLDDTVQEVFGEFRSRKGLSVNALREAMSPMVESVIRNPDACSWLTRLKHMDDYSYRHSVSCSVWAVAVGRQLGLPRKDLDTLALGASLCDVGKLSIPQELLQRRERLSSAEFETVKRHVDYGLEALTQSGGVNNQVLQMVASHHERHNGSGYPQGLRGEEIPVFARIAAMADCYDAITSLRPYAAPVSPSEAVRQLYEWRDIDFHGALVEAFIQAVGLYPAGTLVELSSGQVGVVVAEYRTRRLRPKVMLLLDADKNPCPSAEILDLLTVNEDGYGRPLQILDSLEPGAYGLDLNVLGLG